MQVEKRPFGIVLFLLYIINIFIFLIAGLYVLDLVVKYLHFLNYISPSLIKYYFAMMPVDIIAFGFDLVIIYFLLSARKVIKDRVSGGSKLLNASLLSAVFVYLLKFIFLNLFIYFSVVPVVKDYHFMVMFKFVFVRLTLFLFIYPAFGLLMQYAKSVTWYFGHNYKGLYAFKSSFHLPLGTYFNIVGRVSFVVFVIFSALFLPYISVNFKVLVSLLSGAGAFYWLFIPKKELD